MVRHRNARLNIDLLEELGRQRKSGRKVYLATNQEHIRATYLLEVLGLGDHCDGIFYSAALGCRKPDISFFEKASALSGLPPNQLLLFDDTYANITAARASGWNAAQWHEGRSLSAIIEELVSDPVMMTDVFIDLPCLGIPVQIGPLKRREQAAAQTNPAGDAPPANSTRIGTSTVLQRPPDKVSIVARLSDLKIISCYSLLRVRPTTILVCRRARPWYHIPAGPKSKGRDNELFGRCA
ncbi:HAD-IA family hydrolase [Rhizobium sp. S163]|uniref:HAD family hydrolase n=1 Tax=Rhizobium sp. S163 TaxID=3055039 RepID=UPI0025AA0EFD|nr:HAD-IA family hydrolase [Rhizobium sp. S163]MDM9648343.1 HAD-IA family hydrolase [Rhizobium sp. S163]